MLSCDPTYFGYELGSRLLAEAAARKAGLDRIFTEASERARPVFARAGYEQLHQRNFAIGPENASVAFHNYAMTKMLG